MRELEILNKLSIIRNLDYESIIVIGVTARNGKFVFIDDVTNKRSDCDATVKVEYLADVCKKNGCRYIYIAHNHPKDIEETLITESVQPSEDDISMTDYIKTFLLGRGITLLDHYIVSENQHLSINSYLKTKEYPLPIVTVKDNFPRRQIVLVRRKQ